MLINQNQYQDAVPVLLRAARIGHPRAQAMLGIIYQDGDSVQPNDRAAAYWFGLAVTQGHRAAEYALGAMYEEGEGGLPKDEKKAIELYIRSANQGFGKALLILGVDYELGDGLPRSRPKAIALLRQAGGEGVFMANVLANPHTPASKLPPCARARQLSGADS
jgi:TPR repeat protein